MKKSIYFLLLTFFWCGISTNAISQVKKQPLPSKPVLVMKPSDMVLRHVVLFKFKDSSTPEQVNQVIRAFSALPEKINTIIGYEWGTNISPENLAQGFTHSFLVTFKDAAGRDYYLPHPAHKEFGNILGPHLDKVLVFDFMGRK